MVNPGTFLVIFLLIFQAIYSRNLKKFSVFLFLDAMAFALLANSGYFIRIGALVLEYEEILSLLFLFIYFLGSGFDKINSKTFFKGILLITTALLGVFFLILISHNNITVVPIGASWDAYYAGKNVMVPLSFSSANLERIFRLILFVLMGLCIKDILKSNRNLIAKSLVFFTSLQVLIGLIDLMSKLLFNASLIPNISARIFGVGPSQFIGVVVRGGLPSIQGFMKETGHFADSFIPGLTYLALNKNKSQKEILIEFLSVLILLLSGSFTGFAIVLYWLLLYAYRFVMNSKLGKLPSILVLLTIFFLSFEVVQILSHNFSIIEYYISRLYSLLGIGPRVGSEPIRLMSITYSFDLFIRYPLFGIGIGSSVAHGFIPNLLANMGIIGFLAWLSFSFDVFFINHRKADYFPIILIFLFIMCFLGDIGWTYNMMGISMLIGLHIGIWNINTIKNNIKVESASPVVNKK